MATGADASLRTRNTTKTAPLLTVVPWTSRSCSTCNWSPAVPTSAVWRTPLDSAESEGLFVVICANG